jgi:DNA invertase Pin-like site-specific DNA recombinase
MAMLAYARVSSIGQSLDRQLDALNAAGVDRIFEDKMSGTREDRPGLRELMEYARPGDIVTVVSLDRLGRRLTGIIRAIDELTERGIMLRSLKEGVDFTTPMGRCVGSIFAALAEYERSLIVERAAAGRAAALARGQRAGRKPALTDDQIALAQRMRRSGESINTLILTFPHASRATIYRVIRNVHAEA